MSVKTKNTAYHQQKIFLSHKSEDQTFVNKLISSLRAGNKQIWLNEAEIHVGDSLINKIESDIGLVNYILILSPRVVDSGWWKQEYAFAMHQEVLGRAKLIPVIIEKCELPSVLKDRQYVDFTEPTEFSTALDKLFNMLHSSPSTIKIELQLTYDFTLFNEKKQQALLETMKSLLSSDYNIRITKIEPGSTKLTIEVSQQQAEQLLWLYKRGVLDELDIHDAKLLSNSAVSALIENKVKNESFDVFLCHNAVDKPEVKKIAIQLRKQGILPWLDEWELRPGLPWQRVLESKIKSIGSAAIFVGANGIGPWQNLELEAFIRQFVQRSCPVIPVLLRTCMKKPFLPTFLEGMTWVKLSKRKPNPIDQLIWGITGKRI